MDAQVPKKRVEGVLEAIHVHVGLSNIIEIH